MRLIFSLLLVAFLGSFYRVHAQLGPSLPSTGSNFIVLKDSADRFYSSDSIYRQGNAYGYKTYMRWVSYWEDRLYYGNGQIANMDRRSFQTSTDRTNTQLCQGGGLGETWQAKGPFYFADQKLGMITAVYQHSTNLNLFLISGAIGGIFRSVDGGLNWQNTTEALNLPGMGVQQIIEHPTNGSIIAGTGNGFGMDYGTGIIISNDQGQTWTNYRITAGLTDPTISRVAVDPNDPNILYIQTNYKLYKHDLSQPSQLSVEIPNTALPDNFAIWQAPNYSDMEVVSWNIGGQQKTVLLCATTSVNPINADAKIVKIIDPASSNPIVQDITPLPAANIHYEVFAIDHSEAAGMENVVFAVTRNVDITDSDYNTVSLFRITDANTSNPSPVLVNTKQNSSGFFHSYKNELIVSDVDPNRIYFAGKDVFGSEDGGQIIQIYLGGSQFHVDVRDMMFVKDANGQNPDKVLFGNDGGVSYSDDGFSTIQNFNGNGFNAQLFYGIDVNTSSVVSSGTQDHYEIFKWDGLNWTATNTNDYGDGTHVASDFSDPSKFISAHLYGLKYFRTGVSNDITWPTNVSKFYDQNEPQAHPSGAYFCGLDELYEIKNPYGFYCFQRLSNFQNLDPLPGVYPIRTFEVAPSNAGRLYVSLDKLHVLSDPSIPLERVFYRGVFSNGSVIWTDITQNLTNLDAEILRKCNVSDIEVNPQNENELWITFNNFVDQSDYGRVFHSMDGGNTWEDVSQGLPVYPVSRIKFQNGSNRVLYLGNDIGVYVWDESQHSWRCYSNGLPVTVVKDIAIDYSNGKVFIGTFGRGVFSAQCYGSYASLNSTPYVNYTTAVPQNNVVVNGNEIWTGTKYINGNVVINPGAKLEVRGEVYFSENSSIIVERGTTSLAGGRLLVDGGKLTVDAVCGNTSPKWGGVKVRGYPNLSQTGILTTKQGVCEVRSGGIISNARTGIQVGDYFQTTSIGSGGIVRVRKGNFIDNNIDVIFEYAQKSVSKTLI